MEECHPIFFPCYYFGWNLICDTSSLDQCMEYEKISVTNDFKTNERYLRSREDTFIEFPGIDKDGFLNYALSQGKQIVWNRALPFFNDNDNDNNNDGWTMFAIQTSFIFILLIFGAFLLFLKKRHPTLYQTLLKVAQNGIFLIRKFFSCKKSVQSVSTNLFEVVVDVVEDHGTNMDSKKDKKLNRVSSNSKKLKKKEALKKKIAIKRANCAMRRL